MIKKVIYIHKGQDYNLHENLNKTKYICLKYQCLFNNNNNNNRNKKKPKLKKTITTL